MPEADETRVVTARPLNIFISYRREDAAGEAGRIYDTLRKSFGARHLFMDVDTMRPGDDFVAALESAVAKCDVLLAVIGRSWLTALAEDRSRRLDNELDFVRLEIVAALEGGKVVIPVLVDDAEMPDPNELPEPVRPLARRQAVTIRHARFMTDVADLRRHLRGLQQLKAAASPAAADQETGRTSVWSITEASREAPSPRRVRGRRRERPVIDAPVIHRLLELAERASRALPEEGFVPDLQRIVERLMSPLDVVVLGIGNVTLGPVIEEVVPLAATDRSPENSGAATERSPADAPVLRLRDRGGVGDPSQEDADALLIVVADHVDPDGDEVGATVDGLERAFPLLAVCAVLAWVGPETPAPAPTVRGIPAARIRPGEPAGHDDLRVAVAGELAARAAVLKANVVMERLERILRSDPRSEELLDGLEDLRLTTHGLDELKVLAMARRGELELPAELHADLRRVLTGGSVRDRLAATPNSDAESLKGSAASGAEMWRRFQRGGRAGRREQEAAHTVIGSYHRLWAEVDSGADA